MIKVNYPNLYNNKIMNSTNIQSNSNFYKNILKINWNNSEINFFNIIHSVDEQEILSFITLIKLLLIESFSNKIYWKDYFNLMGLKNHNETKAYHIKIIESLNKKINIFNINFNIDFKGWRGNLDFITISINSSLLKEFNSIDKIPLNLLKYKTKNIHIKILFIILYYFDKQKVIFNLEDLFKTIWLRQNVVQNSYKLKQHLLNFQNENVLKSYTFQNWNLHLNLSNWSNEKLIWKTVKVFSKEEKKIFRKGLKIKINKDIEKEKELKIEISKKLEGLYWNNYIIKNEHYLEKIGSIDTILINKKRPRRYFYYWI